jgi:hypothetical protein
MNHLQHQAMAPAQFIRRPAPERAFFGVKRGRRANGRMIVIKERIVHIEQDAAQTTCHRYNQRLVYRVRSY